MADDVKKTWLKMSERALHTHLTKQGYPPKLVRDTLNRVADIKRKAKSQRVHDNAVKTKWQEVLAPARIELGVVRTIKSQLRAAATEDALKRLDVMAEYESVIVKVIARLRGVQKAGAYTPLQLATELRNAGKLHIEAGDGMHWTDYVGTLDRERIEGLFNRLPDPKRGKKKQPFDRRISRPEHRRQKHALWDRILNEKFALESEHELTTNAELREELYAKIMDMEHAIYNLDKLPPTSPVPRTWRELL